jgi:hypothetical protein
MKNSFILLMALLGSSLSLSAQSMEGTWRTQFMDQTEHYIVVIMEASDGQYTIDYGDDGQIDLEGRYLLKGQQVTLWDTGGDPQWMCPAEAKGRYHIVSHAESLRLERIEDACPGRGGEDGVIAFVRVRE